MPEAGEAKGQRGASEENEETLSWEFRAENVIRLRNSQLACWNAGEQMSMVRFEVAFGKLTSFHDRRISLRTRVQRQGCQ